MQNSLIDTPLFEPSVGAAQARLTAVKPHIYAKTRNDLSGAVTRLSPYITHGFLTIPDAVRQLHEKTPLRFEDKIVFELAWREFFHHVWAHKGDAIFNSINPPVYAGQYAAQLPTDIAQGRTGVPAIDTAVRELYATGYLHNHARMWLASYVVHIRKVHWRAGADWLYAHLLDGDCASNHLSWQWVAGTFSSKPYLFNAENVVRYAPTNSHAHWHSGGTVIDQSYEALDDWARSKKQASAEPGHHPHIDEPATSGVPTDCLSAPNLAERVNGKQVRLVHPWDLADTADDCISIAWLCPAFHSKLPWSHTRWDWVLSRMNELATSAGSTPLWLIGDTNALKAAMVSAASIRVIDTKHAGYHSAIRALKQSLAQCQVHAGPRLLPLVERPCNSFTKFYQTAQKQAGRLESCL